MASRAWYQMLASLVERLTLVQGSFGVAGSGAVGTIKGSGILSVTHRGTGLYDVVLEDQYNRWLNLHVTTVAASPGTASNVLGSALDADPNNLTDGVHTSAKKIKIQLIDATGALVDPTSGAIVFLDVLLRNSGIKGKGE